MNACAFKQVDVFTSRRFFGNALAVLLDADDMTGADMQRIAAWTNLSETAFVLSPTQPQADYRVRIFTPGGELPFAGHPSVGTAHALIEAGHFEAKSSLVQECAAGFLPVRVVGDGSERRIFVRAPRATLRSADPGAAEAAARVLGVKMTDAPPRLVNVGPDWYVCDLGSEAAVRSLKPDFAAIAILTASLGALGVSVFGRAANADYAIAVRAFCPGHGIPEDPVTGSANAAIGAYLLATGGLDTLGAQYRANQGRELGRDGYVDVCVDATTGDVEIGGQSVTCIDGMMIDPGS
jgi:PhzF family phenazine biosynthesis protein